ncbi:MAG: hypothetical protein JO171_07325 [Paludibacterium sp.]|uniref:hypothetical protein n=1 Tax=Paludibacterium sp. TaxID=1917523 RepID=UPI0025FF8D5D|nr:hypothetical protein [Paludibacterium sp.]MBV8046945.1 hypothetical protein [Paludibacterium sp.]MBV8646538.1 hypothetical protein [Paludibacterium sp.]
MKPHSRFFPALALLAGLSLPAQASIFDRAAPPFNCSSKSLAISQHLIQAGTEDEEGETELWKHLLGCSARAAQANAKYQAHGSPSEHE